MSNTLKKWFSDKKNWAIILLLIAAFVIRIHYFSLTSNQPLWWDEAEYMLKAKNIALGTPETGWAQGLRPILFPLITSLSFLLGFGETPIRVLMIFLSLSGIFLVYLTGKEMFNRKVGLAASIMMSVFYIDLFYTTRLLVDVPQMFFVNLAMFLFVKSHFSKSPKKLIWLILPVIFIGVQVRFTVGLLALILFVFLVSVQGSSTFKKKEWYVSAGIALLAFLPYLIYVGLRFGNPFYNLSQGLSSANSARGEGVTAFSIFMQYISYFPKYTNWVFFVSFLAGALIVLFYIVISLDKIRSSSISQKYLLLLLWIIVPLIYFGFFVNHFEDRYLFMVFPAVFIVASFALDKLYLFASRYNKNIGLLVILCFVAYASWSSLHGADNLIKSKISSYEGLKDAGLWMKDNSPSDSVIIGAGMPEITYYSERPTYPYPANESDFRPLINEKNATYLILSIWEPSPDWTYNWPSNNSQDVSIEKVFFTDSSQKQLSAIIYKIMS